MLAGLQFLLNGLNNIVGGWAMFAVWSACAALAVLATIRIERYLARRRRLD